MKNRIGAPKRKLAKKNEMGGTHAGKLFQKVESDR